MPDRETMNIEFRLGTDGDGTIKEGTPVRITSPTGSRLKGKVSYRYLSNSRIFADIVDLEKVPG